MSGSDEDMYGMDHELWCAGQSVANALKVAEKERDKSSLSMAGSLISAVQRRRAVVGVEFTGDEARELLDAGRYFEVVRRGPAYKKLYKALAVEVGGGQNLPPELAPDGGSEAQDRSERAA